MRVRVAFLPDLIEATHWETTTAVVVDVLRATTVIATALAAGASRVITCREVGEAQRIADQLRRDKPDEAVLLVGERGGLPIPGFDLGNSPADFTPQKVRGKTLVQTTTNGTLAIERCATAAKLVTASFVNLNAVAARIVGESEVQIVCAGTDGRITGEDVLLAGALIARAREQSLRGGHPAVRCVGDSALLASRAWAAVQSRAATDEGLADLLMDTQGGRNLERIGLQRDVDDAARGSSIQCVPQCISRSPATFVHLN